MQQLLSPPLSWLQVQRLPLPSWLQVLRRGCNSFFHLLFLGFKCSDCLFLLGFKCLSCLVCLLLDHSRCIRNARLAALKGFCGSRRQGLCSRLGLPSGLGLCTSSLPSAS